MALFPYSNFHDLNMDWIIKTLKQILTKLENLPSGGGGGGGTTDYNDLTNKPSINGVSLSGNKTENQLGIHSIPPAGSTDQVLAKASNSNYDTYWKTVSGGGGGSDEIVEVDYGDSSADVETAYQTGKIVICFYYGRMYILSYRVSATNHIFSHNELNEGEILECVNNVWTYTSSSAVSNPSPALLGVPTAPTATVGTNTTQIATTAFVQAAIAAIPNANGEEF